MGSSSASVKPRCYVASPFGFSEAGRHYHEQVYLPALAEIVTVVDPWGLTSPGEIREAEQRGQQAAFAFEIGRRNREAIQTCALLAAHLDGQEIDAGVAAEIGYAAASGLRCYGVRTDLRESGEPGVRVNLQVEYFIRESGGQLLGTLDELVDGLTVGVAALG